MREERAGALNLRDSQLKNQQGPIYKGGRGNHEGRGVVKAQSDDGKTPRSDRGAWEPLASIIE